jgi:hypothetical protein
MISPLRFERKTAASRRTYGKELQRQRGEGAMHGQPDRRSKRMIPRSAELVQCGDLLTISDHRVWDKVS